MLIARTQTLVQLSDTLLAHLDQRAGQEGRSRSELIREAIEAYLAEGIEAEIDRQIVEAYTRMPQQPWELEWADEAGRRMVEEEPW